MKRFILLVLVVAAALSAYTVAYRNANADDRYVTLGSHSKPVSAVAYSPDGRTAASGDQGGTIKLWDAKKHKRLRTIKTDGRGITALEFSRDSKILAAGWRHKIATEENTGGIVLYDVATGKEVRRLKGHREGVNALAFSPDGKTLASAGTQLDDGNYVGVWDYQAGKLVKSICEEITWRVQFTASGNYLFAQGRFWNTNNWKIKGERWGGGVKVTIDPNSRDIKASLDYVRNKGEVSNGAEENLEHESVVMVAIGGYPTFYSPDGRLIATLQYKQALLVHPRTARSIMALPAHSFLKVIAFSQNARFVVMPGKKYKVRLWDIDRSLRKATGKSLAQLDKDPYPELFRNDR